MHARVEVNKSAYYVFIWHMLSSWKWLVWPAVVVFVYCDAINEVYY